MEGEISYQRWQVYFRIPTVSVLKLSAWSRFLPLLIPLNSRLTEHLSLVNSLCVAYQNTWGKSAPCWLRSSLSPKAPLSCSPESVQNVSRPGQPWRQSFQKYWRLHELGRITNPSPSCFYSRPRHPSRICFLNSCDFCVALLRPVP